jgi:hypothetical protein
LTPPEGARFIVPGGASGAWFNREGKIAQQEIGGWRFVEPVHGLRAWVRDISALVVFTDSGWTDFRTLLGSLSLDQLGVNASTDAVNRMAIASAASLFSHEGGSHRMTINKQTNVDTAALVFQTNYSGHAEFGLTGSDNFSVKVSPDGSTWRDALYCDRTTGTVNLPAGVASPGLPVRVVTAVLSTGFTATTTTPQATGLLVTVTPRSVASQFLVRCHLTLGGNYWVSTPDVTVTRNGTKIWPAGVASMSNRIVSGTLANSRVHTLPASLEFLDSPETASAVTYEIMLASSVSGSNAHLNVRDIDLLPRGESSMIVTEISG